MKERPILMSAPMVCSSLDDTKTQTRRVVKGWALEWLAPGMFTPEYVADPKNEACPYGQPGSHLWVRETYFAWGRWETRFSAKKGRDEWHFLDMTLDSGRKYLFAADNHNYTANLGANQGRGVYPGWWKRDAIFMPRAASRITLVVTDVRVERLQDISEADALAEGIEYLPRMQGYGLPDGSHYHGTDPRISYWSLLEEINGRESVEANPWMWVISFRRLEQEAP